MHAQASAADGLADAATIVYVEDDPRLARLTAQYLTSHGIQVRVVDRGDAAVAAIVHARPDLVLLDLMLPGTDGIEICRALRTRMDVPIIMVTARTEEADRVMGLEGGADDYVNKPFSPRELLARIRAQIRRSRGENGPPRSIIRAGEITVDPLTMTASLAGKALALTTYEFALLRALAERAGQILSREQLLERVHGCADEAFDRSIDVHVSRLRHKLGDNSKNPRLLKTVRGVGYVLAPER
jgi:DNA-binding response OmpR family regulator